MKKYFVYFLESLKNGSYYIGVSGNINKRLNEHNSGLSKSTASNKPWKLRRVEKYDDIKLAYKREHFLKKLKSKKIIKKIIDPDP